MTHQALNNSLHSDDAKTKAAMPYNAAADHFDHPVNSFWHRLWQDIASFVSAYPDSSNSGQKH